MAKVVTDGDIGSGLEIVAGKLNRSAITKADVGLGNVDNTSDIDKPVSTAQQTAINAVVEDAIVDGVTTKAPSQNAVFDALNGFVKTTTAQSITGEKTFNNTSTANAITTNNNSTGKGINSVNTSTGIGISSSNTSSGKGIQSVNTSIGSGIYSLNSLTGAGISSENTANGNGIFSSNSSTGNGISSSNSSTGNGISTTNGSTGNGLAASNVSTGKGISSSNTSTGIGIYSFNKLGGTGIFSDNNSTGDGIRSDNDSSGNAIVAKASSLATGFNYVGKNSNVNTFTVDKFGLITATSININSTTSGSLPFPRMTQAQRLAIASPATGTHVYQTDGTEGVYVNKSTGWAFAY